MIRLPKNQFTAAVSWLIFCGLLVVGCAERQPAKIKVIPLPESQATATASPQADAAAEITNQAPGLPPMGYIPPTDEQRNEFLRTLEKPTFEQAAPHFFAARGPPTASLVSAADKKPVLLYLPLYEAYQKKFGKPWVVGAQGIGDCVSWGWAHGITILLAVDYVNGTSGDFDIVATESNYGLMRVEAVGKSRGGYSDGCYGAAAAKAAKWGVVFRRDYRSLSNAECDLLKYSASRAKQWGNFGCGGSADNGRLDTEAKKHAVKQVALVTTFEEAAAAIENGYPIPVCSGQGFSSVRDKDGFCAARGSWSHCMCFIGVRYDRPGLLCLNSWGPNWVSGPKWPNGDGYVPGDPRGPPAAMPDGSFWVDAKVAERMLSGRDSYAVSNLVGFPARKLKHAEGW